MLKPKPPPKGGGHLFFFPKIKFWFQNFFSPQKKKKKGAFGVKKRFFFLELVFCFRGPRCFKKPNSVIQNFFGFWFIFKGHKGLNQRFSVEPTFGVNISTNHLQGHKTIFFVHILTCRDPIINCDALFYKEKGHFFRMGGPRGWSIFYKGERGVNKTIWFLSFVNLFIFLNFFIWQVGAYGLQVKFHLLHYFSGGLPLSLVGVKNHLPLGSFFLIFFFLMGILKKKIFVSWCAICYNVSRAISHKLPHVDVCRQLGCVCVRILKKTTKT